MSYGTIVRNTKKNELDKIQHEAARIVTGATKLISINNLYKEVCWESLDKRRQDHKLFLFYKMCNNLVPNYLSSLVPPQVSTLSHYNLRNSSNLQVIKTNTNIFYNSFIPSATRAWNNLLPESRNLPTLNSFKQFCKRGIKTVPRYYYVGSRKAQILHTRLRTGCSSLNMDLFLKNITDSPMCRCGSLENVQHFFFHCNLYHDQRTVLLRNLSLYQTPSLQLILYGDLSLSQDINETIFEQVHKFILV